MKTYNLGVIFLCLIVSACKPQIIREYVDRPYPILYVPKPPECKKYETPSQFHDVDNLSEKKVLHAARFYITAMSEYITCLEEVVEEQNKLNVKTSKNIESLVNILEQKNGIKDPIIKSALEGVGYYDK